MSTNGQIQNEDILLFWQTHPLDFCRDIIGFYPDPLQEELIIAISEPGAWVSAKSGHGTGKTSTLACLALWFISVFPDAKVPVTHPSMDQLKATLWPEMRKWHAGMLEPFKSAIDIQTEKVVIRERENTFIQARTARKENPDALQGFHAEHVLFLVDEASGVPSKIFEVAMGALTTKDTRFLLTGNPTNTVGFFYNTFYKKGARELWKRFTMSCLDSQNVDKAFAEKIASQYGKDSNEYRVRVLGEFPLASASQFIGRGLVDEASNRYEFITSKPDMYKFSPIILGVDVARFGDDWSCVFLRQGLFSKEVLYEKDLSTTQLAAKVSTLYNSYRADSVCVDMSGVGAGVFDTLISHGYPAIGTDFGEAADDKEAFALKRSELWSRTRDWLRRGGTIPDDEILKDDLCAPRYEFNERNKLKIERKEKTKEVLGRSPDKADALILTFDDLFCERRTDDYETTNRTNNRIITSDDKPLFNYAASRN